MAALPPQFAYALNRLSGYSTNIFKLEPQGSNSAVANNIIRITLPANSLVNLRSFALHFNAAITSATGEGRLPNKIDSLIERIEVGFGGVMVSQGNNNYNLLRHVKDALQGDKTDPVFAHPAVVRDKSYHSSAGTNGITAKYEVSSKYIIDAWEGFLGTLEPGVLDLSLLPECVIAIHLSSNNVCVDASGVELSGHGSGIDVNAASPAPVYQLSNIYATVECVGMADGAYDAMVSAMLNSGTGLELPYKQYISFQDNTQSTMRWSVATQSLDRVWISHRDTGYNQAGGAVPIKGYKVAGAFAASTSGGGTTQDLGKPEIADVLNYDKEKYTTKYFDMPTTNATGHQLALNGALFPQFQADFEDFLMISKNSLPLRRSQKDNAMLTLKNNYNAFCVRLNLADSELTRTISGMDTRGIALNGFYNLVGASNSTVNIFAETTSTLRIGPGLQLEVVQ